MLWINNEYGLEDELAELVRERRDDPYAAGNMVRGCLEQYQEEMGLVPQTGMEADLFRWVWDMVDWYNIGENILDGIEWDDEDDGDEDNPHTRKDQNKA
jgi:hypothetical protein